jgi:hypothetical protein
MNKVKIGLWGLGISALSLVTRATLIELRLADPQTVLERLDQLRGGAFWSFSYFPALMILGIIAGVVGITFLCWGLLTRSKKKK